MELVGKGFSAVAQLEDTIEVARPVDKVCEGTSIDIERSHALVKRSVRAEAFSGGETE
ncbi:hypothetical protein [Nonomuraea wenchangensis]|uniref:hypothetical protein n=1 Tax=Nonomuraea wenchangensis TaxID=568860 RepID=UPI0033FCEF85